MPPALEIRALSKSFGRKVVDGLDLTVRPGEFYALLGPNGAGKTTTLRMVAGLLPADAGEIRVFGVDARRNPIEAKRIVAWLPDEPHALRQARPARISRIRRRPLGRRARARAKAARRTCSTLWASGRSGASAARVFHAA